MCQSFEDFTGIVGKSEILGSGSHDFFGQKKLGKILSR